MKNYYRLMLGKGSSHAPECFAGGFIGTDFEIQEDLSGKLPDQWKEFNKLYIPVYLMGEARKPIWSKIKTVANGRRKKKRETPS